MQEGRGDGAGKGREGKGGEGDNREREEVRRRRSRRQAALHSQPPPPTEPAKKWRNDPRIKEGKATMAKEGIRRGASVRVGSSLGRTDGRTAGHDAPLSSCPSRCGPSCSLPCPACLRRLPPPPPHSLDGPDVAASRAISHRSRRLLSLPAILTSFLPSLIWFLLNPVPRPSPSSAPSPALPSIALSRPANPACQPFLSLSLLLRFHPCSLLRPWAALRWPLSLSPRRAVQAPRGTLCAESWCAAVHCPGRQRDLVARPLALRRNGVCNSCVQSRMPLLCLSVAAHFRSEIVGHAGIPWTSVRNSYRW